MGLLLLDLERLEEAPELRTDPAEIGHGPRDGGDDRHDLSRPLPPSFCRPRSGDLDQRRDYQEAPDRPHRSGEVPEQAGPPPASPPDGDEEGERQQDEERLRVSHHEDEGRRRQHHQPHGAPGEDLVPEFGADQCVDPDRHQQTGHVGDQERGDTDGQRGDVAQAAVEQRQQREEPGGRPGQRPVPVGGDALVPTGVGAQEAVARFEHRLGVRNVEVPDLVLGQAQREKRDGTRREPREPRHAERLEDQAPTTPPALEEAGRTFVVTRQPGVGAERHRGRRVQSRHGADVCT